MVAAREARRHVRRALVVDHLDAAEARDRVAVAVALHVLSHQAELRLGRALHVVAIDRLAVVQLADRLDVVLHTLVGEQKRQHRQKFSAACREATTNRANAFSRSRS